MGGGLGGEFKVSGLKLQEGRVLDAGWGVLGGDEGDGGGLGVA